MLKKIIKMIKKIIVTALLIYSYDVIASLYGYSIPINILTVSSVSILGIPCLFVLVVLKILVF